MAASDTKKRILDAAQHEFAEHSYHGTSIRSIADRADVKLGAIRYHFGSKDDLFEAVLARHASAVSDIRKDLEDKQDESGKPPSIEEAVRILLQPVLDVRHNTEDGMAFARVVANTTSDPGEKTAVLTKKLFDPSTANMIKRLEQAAPGLDKADLYWAFFLSVGAMAMACRNGDRLSWLSEGLADPNDAAEMTENLITFAAGGVAALADKKAKAGR
jgi:AcrR family transcriptional regulator